VVFVFVPIWGAFILCLDRWLMSGVGVPNAMQRFRKLLPRFILAVMFGTIIAEPLLLGIFHTAVEAQVQLDRQTSVARYQSNLKRCNPDPVAPTPAASASPAAGPSPAAAASGGADATATPTPAPSSGSGSDSCSQYLLNTDQGAAALQQQLAQTEANADSLKVTIDADSTQYTNLTEKAQEECVGDKGQGLTGHAGWGPNCRARQNESAQFLKTSQLNQHEAAYTADENQIASLNQKIGDLQKTQVSANRTAIDNAVKVYKAKFKDIGLLERMKALSELVAKGGYVLAGEWALRIFFITVDSLPVLSKLLSGYTAYDRMAANRLQAQERAQRAATETERRDALLREELQRYRLNAEHASGRKKVELDARLRYLNVEIMHENLVDARTEYLLEDGPTISFNSLAGGGNDPAGGAG
jgi:hypothetical protein